VGRGGREPGFAGALVVASDENHLILNPSHPRFQEVRVLSKQRVVLDRRLYPPNEAPLERFSKKKRWVRPAANIEEGLW
jgi:hypothetical protein